MTYASPWFGTLYAAAFVTGIAILIAGDRIDRRLAATLGTLVAVAAGISGGLAIKGLSTDVSGIGFSLPAEPAEPVALPSVLGPARGKAGELSVDTFGDAHGRTGLAQTLVVPLDDDVMAEGWAFDVNDHARCAAVAMVVDGHVYPAVYGGARSDVASRFGPDHLTTGYRVVVPAAVLGAGKHRVDVRCISAAGASFASNPLSLEVTQ